MTSVRPPGAGSGRPCGLCQTGGQTKAAEDMRNHHLHAPSGLASPGDARA